MNERPKKFLPGVVGEQDAQGINMPAPDLQPSQGATTGNGPLAGLTPNYSLNLVNFDWITWHNYEWDNWQTVDALLQVAIGFLNIVGVWRPQTAYIAGQTVFDPTDLNVLWLCELTHTSGTQFDQAEQDAYWSLRENADPPVTSVHSRIGDVVSEKGDYGAFQITAVGPFTFSNGDNVEEVLGDHDSVLTSHNSRLDGLDTEQSQQNARLDDIDAHQIVQDDLIQGNADDITLRVRWRNPYNFGTTYETNDMVFDAPWTMIANKQTLERAAPQPDGNPIWDLPDVPAFATNQHLGTVRSGREWDVLVPASINAYSVWAPTLNDDTKYTIWLYSYPTGNPDQITYQQISEPLLNEGAWTEVQRNPTLITAGTTFGILLDALNSGSSIAPGGTPADWIRQTDANNADPTTGGWNHNVQQTLLRIHENTADAALIDMVAVVAGSKITLTSTDNPNSSITYRCNTDEVYAGGVYSWTVQVSDTGPAGEPPVGVRCVVSFDVPVAAPTDYVQEAGANPTANTRGILEINGVPVAGVEGDAFGVRIEFETYIVSDDWDIVAYSGNSGGGGGGAPGEGGTPNTTGPEFPSAPGAGDLHYLTVDPVGLYIYYDDGDSQQWVQTNGGDFNGDDYVLKSGDTMTGNLTIDNAASGILYVQGDEQANIYLQANVGGANPSSANHIWFQKNGSNVGLLYNDSGNNMSLRHYNGGTVGGNLQATANGIAISGIDGSLDMRKNDLWRCNRIGWDSSSSGDYIQWFTAEGLRGYENGIMQWRLGSGGQFTQINSVYDRTSGAGANIYVTTSAQIVRSTSAGKYKTDIRPVSVEKSSGDVIDRLNPVLFQSVHEVDKGRNFAGFIAEEVGDIMPYAMEPDGENYDTRAIVAHLVDELKSLRKRVAELEAKPDA